MRKRLGNLRFSDIFREREHWSEIHCVKGVHIRSFSGPYFPAFGLNTERYYGPGKL